MFHYHTCFRVPMVWQSIARNGCQTSSFFWMFHSVTFHGLVQLPCVFWSFFLCIIWSYARIYLGDICYCYGCFIIFCKSAFIFILHGQFIGKVSLLVKMCGKIETSDSQHMYCTNGVPSRLNRFDWYESIWSFLKRHFLSMKKIWITGGL